MTIRRNRARNRNVPGSQQRFSTVAGPTVSRSIFDRSHGLKTSLDTQYLYPILWDEALPGDTLSCRTSILCRMTTPLHPFYDNMNLDVFFFAVPKRLLWDNFKRFMGEQDNPGDSTDYTVPQITVDGPGFPHGSLADYLGLPVDVPALSVAAWWHRAYAKIWNEWFRDENFADSHPEHRDDTARGDNNYPLLPRFKRHDYFTSALPWPQKGPSVNLSLGDTAPLGGQGRLDPDNIGFPVWMTDSGEQGGVFNREAEIGNNPPDVIMGNWEEGGREPIKWQTAGLVVNLEQAAPGFTTPYADLTAATAMTVNNMRDSIALQHMLERDARGGTRYTEKVRSFFGVESPDHRLQRSEYLGGFTIPLTVNPVTANATEDQGQAATSIGDLGAYAAFFDAGRRGFSKSFTEHTVILGLASIRADLTYQQGIDRMFSRLTQYDYFWPQLANLGEQPIYNKEIFATGTAQDDEEWGYQERYSEYRYKRSCLTNHMRSSSPISLDTFHLAQDFASLPALSEDFLKDDPPIDRVLAIASSEVPPFRLDAWFDYRCVRPIPIRSIPGLRRF